MSTGDPSSQGGEEGNGGSSGGQGSSSQGTNPGTVDNCPGCPNVNLDPVTVKASRLEDGYGDTFKERVSNGQLWLDFIMGEGGFAPDPNVIQATVPDLPIGPGGPVKVVKYAANAKKVVVIGEKMAERVIPYAKEINATWFKPTGKNAANWMRNQVQWIRRQIKDPNTTIVDIGPKGPKPVSPYYQKELNMLKKWLGY
jgi:hypothetical protein